MEFLKVMFTVKNEPLIWNCFTETEISINNFIYRTLNNQIDLENWSIQYSKSYEDWLYDDIEIIYDIHSPINIDMVNAIAEVNKQPSDFFIFYWFDVNRDKFPNFNWVRCPLSGKELVLLNDHFHHNNRKISTDYALIFPQPII